MFRKVLVANRGEIACRIIRTLKRLGIGSVAVHSEADRHALHALIADESVCIGPAAAAASYLKQDALIEAALRAGAEAVHPGYGFLSESAEFARRCAAAGLVFVGPTPEQIRDFGLKHRARELAAAAGVPLLPGSGLLNSLDEALTAARRVGYPLMLKSSAGGGGIGMQRVGSEAELAATFARIEELARRNFGGGGVFLERFVESARHLEVQIFGDGRGKVVALGERDCSVQRRNQKVIEETPAPGLAAPVRAGLWETAIALGRSVRYRSAGTVEFVYDDAREAFYFLEVNTRLQVEHGITEAVTGIDLVEWMIRVAAQDPGFELEAVQPRGAAIEARIYAEDPARGFRPSTGLVTKAHWPTGEVRVDHWIEDGTRVTAHYDPLLAKLIVQAADRGSAVVRLGRALAETTLAGIETNLDYLAQFVASEAFVRGGVTTRALERFHYRPRSIEVLSAGTQTTVQDAPGRVGYWSIGVPPSGPMDARSFRLANAAVGNQGGEAGLEFTMSGPTLRFDAATIVCLAGAPFEVDLDGEPVEFWKSFRVPAGATLRIGALRAGGCRGYLAVRGGVAVPEYLGSRATFTLGRFGGHAGRALAAGDVLHLLASEDEAASWVARTVPADLVPEFGHSWELGVLDGPHGAPDFFTPEDIETLYAASWGVHYNSSRTGVRLIGPRPRWARSDGGEAGLHPSNIHDTAYSIGAVDFTGDMPVILGPDGPSLGGFVCPVTVAEAELWKVGQLRPKDRVRFERLSSEDARELDAREAMALVRVRADGGEAAPRPRAPRARRCPPPPAVPAVLAVLAAQAARPAVTYRRSGDAAVLVEYGPMVLDLELRFRVHALMRHLEAEPIAGVLELTPGIRSIQVRFDRERLPLDRLLDRLVAVEDRLAGLDDFEINSRIVHLPLSWDDASTQEAIRRYMQSVRADAPWCPSNIEFIRRINGLDRIEDVRRIVFEASYLVLGLGDVYLGAPVATPLDPRHRLVTTKYNPARTWTPENAVGIGGAYLCVYGMEGPGGYQFIGRTCQMWNTHRSTAQFAPGRPWLLEYFDQIRFFPVTGEELTEFRAQFPYGRAKLEIGAETLRLKDYRRFLEAQSPSIRAWKERQQGAFEAERARWEAMSSKSPTVEAESGMARERASEPHSESAPASDGVRVASPVSGSVWRVHSRRGERVRTGDVLVLVESMKMEISVAAHVDGVVREVHCREGSEVEFGQTLVVIAL